MQQLPEINQLRLISLYFVCTVYNSTIFSWTTLNMYGNQNNAGRGNQSSYEWYASNGNQNFNTGRSYTNYGAGHSNQNVYVSNGNSIFNAGRGNSVGYGNPSGANRDQNYNSGPSNYGLGRGNQRFNNVPRNTGHGYTNVGAGRGNPNFVPSNGSFNARNGNQDFGGRGNPYSSANRGNTDYGVGRGDQKLNTGNATYNAGNTAINVSHGNSKSNDRPRYKYGHEAIHLK